MVDIVGRYVPLKKGGANFMGLCPSTAKISVVQRQSVQAVLPLFWLRQKTGMPLVFSWNMLNRHGLCRGGTGPGATGGPAGTGRRHLAAGKRARRRRPAEAGHTDRCPGKAAEAYRRQLRESPRAIAYFKGTGVSGQVARDYGLGYAPEGWRSLASVFPQYDDPLLEESGLVIVNPDDGDKRYDRFRDRVMFPIRNVRGRCIGFGGRVLGDDKPKYLNSPETPVFHKGRELYGLFEARTAIREQGYALVTEGYMDVVALAQLGFPTPSPPWARPAPRTMCKSSCALRTRWCSASMATAQADAQPARPSTAPCRTRAIRAVSSSCSCPPNTTRTALCAPMAATPSPA